MIRQISRGNPSDKSYISNHLQITMKTINLNAFNEKLIHRYLIEVFYGIYPANNNIRKSLLPDWTKNKKLNMIVPESDRGSVRPDLELVFSDSSILPIEVKWKSSDLNKPNQIEYLQSNRGHLISLNNDKDVSPGISSGVIEFEHFQKWLAENSLTLLGDSVSIKSNLADGVQYWLCSPKSAAMGNYEAMRVERDGSFKNHFWAFENFPQNIANHLRIRKGDKLIFLLHDSLGLGVESGHQMKDDSNVGLNIRKWVIYEATEPYSISLNDELSTFFEEGNPEIGKRRWPHFIHFDLLHEGADYFLEKRGTVSRELVLSSHPKRSKGGPVPLTKTQFDNLKSKFLSSLS